MDPAEAIRRRDRIWPAKPAPSRIDYRHDAQRELLRGPARRRIPGYADLVATSAHDRALFSEPNDFFMGIDSRMLFVLLLELAPRRVIEIGSGWSTRLMAAINHHLMAGRMDITAIDPEPSGEVRGGLPGLARVRDVLVQDVPLDEFRALGRGDLLFIDSSHVLKTGSDVEFLVCHVLPELADGVIVHFHDVFLPFDYPYEWVVEQRRDWNEQYLVQAILTPPTDYIVLFSSRYAMWALHDELVSALGAGAGVGQSLWLRVDRRSSGSRRRRRRRAEEASVSPGAGPPPAPALAYDPDLVPSLSLMQSEGIDVLEEWFRWGEEWSALLRIYGRLGRHSRVLEIGCGLGRTAFPLRYLLPGGSYQGFDVSRTKIEFLQRFTARYPNFRFLHADLRNTEYNPTGSASASDYRFPGDDGTYDVVYAASVFTHLLPASAAHYLVETARVLAPGGRALISVFLLDSPKPSDQRPHPFSQPVFDFAHSWGDERGFAVGDETNPERMSAYTLDRLIGMAQAAGLVLVEPVVPGTWSGAHESAVGAQDLLVLGHGGDDRGALRDLRGESPAAAVRRVSQAGEWFGSARD